VNFPAPKPKPELSETPGIQESQAQSNRKEETV
jgi:hypothetical protein